MDEIKVATEPLPFVPAIWTDLKLSWGLPRRFMRLVIRSSPGLMPNFKAPCKSSGTFESDIGLILRRLSLFFRVVIYHVLLFEDHELTHYVICDYDEDGINELYKIFVSKSE